MSVVRSPIANSVARSRPWSHSPWHRPWNADRRRRTWDRDMRSRGDCCSWASCLVGRGGRTRVPNVLSSRRAGQIVRRWQLRSHRWARLRVVWGCSSPLYIGDRRRGVELAMDPGRFDGNSDHMLDHALHLRLRVIRCRSRSCRLW